MRSKPSYGAGKGKTEAFWKDLFQAMQHEAYIEEGSNLNAAGWNYSTMQY